MTSITCQFCNIQKEPAHFPINKRNAHGKNRECLECLKKRSGRSKECCTCKVEKPSAMFNNSKRSKDGLSFYCKECVNARNRILWKERNEANCALKNILTTETYECTRCNCCKVITEFSINNRSNLGHSKFCKACAAPKKKYSRDQARIWEERYQANNPEKIKEKNKRHSQVTNRRVRISMNGRIRNCLMADGAMKRNTTYTYVGCTPKFLREWFEFQFTDGMKWENFGKWHIDHVKPCWSYDFTQEDHIKECFHWTNLQPLWERENLQKSGRVDKDIIENHKRRVELFMAQVKEGELTGTS